MDTITSSYNSLKKRRDYEIEGFTNDILMLRKQLKLLEKNILKYGPLEDKELVLLTIGKSLHRASTLSHVYCIAKNTGEKAEKISTELQGLKVSLPLIASLS